MQDVELFLSLAEIAGVFIGFGALIAVRSGSQAAVLDVVGVGMVVLIATDVVIMALAPIAISRFGVDGHELWVICGVMGLLLWWGGDQVVVSTSKERRAFMAAAPMKARWRGELVTAAAWVPANLALVLAVLGWPAGQEAALYFAAAVLFLVMDALLLLMLVFRVGFPAVQTGPAGDAVGPAATSR